MEKFGLSHIRTNCRKSGKSFKFDTNTAQYCLQNLFYGVIVLEAKTLKFVKIGREGRS